MRIGFAETSNGKVLDLTGTATGITLINRKVYLPKRFITLFFQDIHTIT